MGMVRQAGKEKIVEDIEEWKTIESLCWNCKTKCAWLLYRDEALHWWYKIWDLAYKCKVPSYQTNTNGDLYLYRIVKCRMYIKGKRTGVNLHGGRPRKKSN